MTSNDYEELYRKNNDFREYVDRYCLSRNIFVQEALKHKIVQEVGDYYNAN